MSKTLLLLRHAKSSWDAPAHSDFERPLNRRGERSAAVIGIMMKQEKIAPDLILCSSARRTVQTRDIIRPYLPRNCPVEETSRIYEASMNDIFAVLSELPDNVQKPLLIGHNPGLAQLTLFLCSTAGGEALTRVQEKFPTGALAEIELDIDTWNEIAPGKGRLRRFVAPKDLV
ncbi:histidine phosphatase family protein [Nisaea sp.]|uniref:SixA phosphatase family protein n=1 Tax=Nisaea sp. TaxID=2024842 RepID=UPI002B274E6A|nr:histidine phosphatase family protein [Nisaea sp.]